MKRKNIAFTAAEALFALVIIGVIAAFTIPIVVQNSYGRETILKVKKAHSILSNSYENATTKYGEISEWSSVTSAVFNDRMMSAMLAAKNCGTDANLGMRNDCVPDCPNIYKAGGGYLNTCTSSDVAKMMSTDGTSYAFQIESPNCDVDVTNDDSSAPLYLKQVCGTALADIFNSQKGRNRNLYGVDLFLFYITRDGIYPVGLSYDKKYPYEESKCVKGITTNVIGCTARMIYGKEKIE